MAGIETVNNSNVDEQIIEETLIDPETDEELVFSGKTLDEVEQAIDAHFNPFFADEEDGAYYVG